MKRGTAVNVLKITAFAGLVAGLYLLEQEWGFMARLDPEALRKVDNAWSPPWIGAYFALWVVAGSLTVPTIAGGILFGWAGGTALGLCGAVVASTVQLLLVRTLLRAPAEAFFGERIVPVQGMLEERGPAVLVAWRLLWLPHNVLVVATALTRIPVWQFAGATVAMLPGMLAVNLLSDSLLVFGPAAVPAERWVALVVLVGVSAGTWAWAQRKWPALRIVRPE